MRRSAAKMTNEIRYFSMFTGVGGFELGLGAASNRNGKYNCEEENSQDTRRNQPISQGQEEPNHPTDNGEVTTPKDPNRTLLQNGQKPSNTEPRDMEEFKGDTKSRQPIRQTSDGVLRERSGVRDDEKSVQLEEDSPNIIESTNNPQPLPTIEQDQQRRNGTTNEQGALLCTGQSSTFTCVGMSEWDKYSSQVLKYRFPNIKNWGDCNKIRPEDLPDFDMLCGGSPCQDFSIAGKRKGLFKEDGSHTRSGLFYQFLRIASVKRPKYMLIENVKGMLSSKNKETGEYNFDSMMEAVCDLGYVIDFTILNSKFFGVPQNRERVIVLAIREDCIDKAKVI